LKKNRKFQGRKNLKMTYIVEKPMLNREIFENLEELMKLIVFVTLLEIQMKYELLNEL